MRIDKSILETFELFPQAVAVVSEGKIEYVNKAAVDILGKKALKMPAAMFFPSILLDGDADTVSGETFITGRKCRITSTKKKNLRVIIMTPMEDEGDLGASPQMVKAVMEPIRTNIAVFKGGLEILGPEMENLGDEKSLKYMAMIERSIYSMRRLVDNFITLSSPGRYDDSREEYFDIVELCRSTVETTAYLLSNMDMNITWESDRDKLIFLGTYKEIERMVLNILANSAKYTTKGGRIRLTLRCSDEQVVISVEDNGYGIKPEILSTVFTRFENQRDLSDGKAGAGLGLAVARLIAQWHKGNIVVESSLGKGTRVTVRLPVRKRKDILFKSPSFKRGNGGELWPYLMELSDVLDYSVFITENIH